MLNVIFTWHVTFVVCWIVCILSSFLGNSFMSVARESLCSFEISCVSLCCVMFLWPYINICASDQLLLSCVQGNFGGKSISWWCFLGCWLDSLHWLWFEVGTLVQCLCNFSSHQFGDICRCLSVQACRIWDYYQQLYDFMVLLVWVYRLHWMLWVWSDCFFRLRGCCFLSVPMCVASCLVLIQGVVSIWSLHYD